MDYTVIAKKFTTNGLIADKRVHIGLTHEQADQMFKRYVRGKDRYWAEVRMFREDVDE